jgi:hypothetical protein
VVSVEFGLMWPLKLYGFSDVWVLKMVVLGLCLCRSGEGFLSSFCKNIANVTSSAWFVFGLQGEVDRWF